MGFSFKVAPGVRIRASSRGVRTSIGPRAARVHVGAGRTGFSSGIGPVNYYTSARGGGRRTAVAGTSRPAASPARQLAQAAKAQEAHAAHAAFNQILNLHRADFVPLSHPVLPTPPGPDQKAMYAARERAELTGISMLQRSARAEAKRRAAELANRDVQAEWERRWSEHVAQQQAADQWWTALCANDPDTVIGSVEHAFSDNEAPAAVVGVAGAELSLVVLVPSIETLPERMPTTTAAGNLSMKKLTKSDRAAFYFQMVSGCVLITVKEALAVAPAIDGIRVVAIRRTAPNAYGAHGAECLFAARFDRSALAGVQWHAVDAATIVNDVSTERALKQRAATRELLPIDLRTEPELATMMKLVDLDELA